MRGLVADPDRVDATGLYASDTDRLCLVPRGGGYRIGASVDYGEAQGCLARGTAKGRGSLAVDLGGGCRFTAKLDGDRLTFPALVPPACDRACRGRATLATLTADRLSASASEAASAPAADGAPLCS